MTEEPSSKTTQILPKPGRGQTVLVTGAGSGLGRAIAERFARRGDRVFATVRDPVRARELEAQARASGLQMSFLALELTSAEAVRAVLPVLEAAGGLDVLIHNAGFGVFGAVEEVGAEDVARQFAVNVFGPLELTRQLLPMLRARRGRVVWIGSLAGRLALPFQAHYSATKAAVAALSDAMRIELAPFGVAVVCVEPGDFATGFTSAPVISKGGIPTDATAAARGLECVETQERSGPAPDWVARVVEAVVQRRHPPARRPVGRWARLLCVLARILPDRLRERMVAGNYGLAPAS